jgi:hypothetical protein
MINNGDHKVVRHKMGIVKLQTKKLRQIVQKVKLKLLQVEIFLQIFIQTLERRNLFVENLA